MVRPKSWIWEYKNGPIQLLSDFFTAPYPYRFTDFIRFDVLWMFTILMHRLALILCYGTIRVILRFMYIIVTVHSLPFLTVHRYRYLIVTGQEWIIENGHGKRTQNERSTQK